MSETIAKKQQQTKPKFEDVIATRASMTVGDRQISHAFLDYCKANKITYRWSSTNRWTLSAKSKTLGYLAIGFRSKDDNSWSIMIGLNEFLQYEDFIRKEGLSEIILNNLNYCEKCNPNVCGSCNFAKKHGCENCTNPCPGTVILGKEFHKKMGNGLCGAMARFKNPDAEALKNAQKILDFWLAIPQGTASRPIFDPATAGLTRIDNKASVSGISDENMANLFNGKYNSYFYAGSYDYMSIGNIHSIEFELDKPTALAMYSVVTGLRIDVPHGWSFYGAELNGSWTLLDVQHEIPAPIARYMEKAYSVDATKAYQRYRIIFEGTHFVLSQVHLYL